MLRRLLVASAFVALAAVPAQAQVPLLDIRLGAHGALPQGDFADTHDAGVGAYFRAGVPLLLFKVMGSVTYTQFKSANPLTDDVQELMLQAGPHFSPLPLLDLGAEVGYTTDAKEWAFAPNVSVGLLMLEATASYVKPFKSGANSFVTLGVGLRF
ncbi:MAG: hypothetical protein C0503_00120 [Gemmatimonas sp.]|nr:hypothetical protein [Gemmatimonas sp.]